MDRAGLAPPPLRAAAMGKSRGTALELQAAYPPPVAAGGDADAHERALAVLFMELKCAPTNAAAAVRAARRGRCC